jgi:hypothetical protein
MRKSKKHRPQQTEEFQSGHLPTFTNAAVCDVMDMCETVDDMLSLKESLCKLMDTLIAQRMNKEAEKSFDKFSDEDEDEDEDLEPNPRVSLFKG